MIKKTIVLFFLISFSVITNAQLKNAPKINVGIARRPELFELSNYPSRGRRDKGYQSNIGRMSNPNLVVELNQRLNNERWMLQFSNYFSHNYLATRYDSGNRIHTDIYAFKLDVFIDAIYEVRFRKFKNSFILIGGGVGRMNISKKFDYNYPTGGYDSSYNRFYQKKSTSLSFWAPRLMAGFRYRNISAFVTAHYTPDGDFNPKPSLWVEYKLLYSFQLKKRKKKIS
jgi:hypothetical protein